MTVYVKDWQQLLNIAANLELFLNFLSNSEDYIVSDSIISGANPVLTSTLLATVPTPLEWSPTVGSIMIIANILAIAFGKFTIKYPRSEPAVPAANFFGGFGLPAVLATTAFGHILGAGIILGLHNIGRI